MFCCGPLPITSCPQVLMWLQSLWLKCSSAHHRLPQLPAAIPHLSSRSGWEKPVSQAAHRWARVLQTSSSLSLHPQGGMGHFLPTALCHVREGVGKGKQNFHDIVYHCACDFFFIGRLLGCCGSVAGFQNPHRVISVVWGCFFKFPLGSEGLELPVPPPHWCP